MIKTSLTRKLIIVFSAILVAVVAFNIVINALLLSTVHRNTKIDEMEELYKTISSEYQASADNSSILEIVKNKVATENLRVFIWDSNENLIIDSLPFSNQEEQNREEPTERNYNPQMKAPRKNFRFDRMELFIFNAEIDDEETIISNDEYSIFSYVHYSNFEEKTLCLRGFLPNDYKILIQMSYASIDEAVVISNTLQLFVGLAMLLVGIVIVSVTSRTIVKPVKELSSIAKSMENLDFSKKYSGSSSDEIGSLGDSINSLSSKLESAINELYEKNEKLQQDIELKSRIDTMRKEFIANASHELKTPLAIISGYAEGLRDNIAGDEESKALFTDVIIEEADKMDHIIRQMMDLMELDSCDELLDGREIALSSIVEESLNSFDLILKNKDVRVTCNIEDEGVIVGDYFRLYQAVTNYISNAINHVDDKKIIDVSLKKTDDKVIFSVYNSGVCISGEDISNIWERFYKVDKSHSREYGGTGLGLSIVRSVIELHGGEYGVKNNPDGVEFYFVLNSKENGNEI